MVRLQTGSTPGTYHRGDPHPTVPDRYFFEYARARERWVTLDYWTRRRRYDRDRQTFRKKDRPDINAAHEAARRARKAKHTPRLTQEEKKAIAELYLQARYKTEETGEQWHVDHNVPLRYPGRILHGRRHHPGNMQVVPAAWNISKGHTVACCWVPDLRRVS